MGNGTIQERLKRLAIASGSVEQYGFRNLESLQCIYERV